MKANYKAILIFILSINLISCGGGGSSSNNNSDTVDDQPVDTGGSDNGSNPDSGVPPDNATPCIENCEFPGSQVLGRPTNNSIAISVITAQSGQVNISYSPHITGAESTLYASATDSSNQLSSTTINTVENIPSIIELTNLAANTLYRYHLNYKNDSDDNFVEYSQNTFHTQRAENQAFSFAVHADPHLGIRVRGQDEEEKADEAHYAKTMANTLASNVDFMIDLGDTFMSEKNASRDFYDTNDANDKTDPLRIWVEEDYQRVRGYFSQITQSVPLFLANGNHEGETGWEKNDPNSIAVWANNLRKQYFPVPTANDFYEGSSNIENHVGTHDGYYAWQWGNAQFIVLDPFWYGSEKAKVDNEWQWTLGKEQYDWLKQTLSNSNAPYKFVFMHNLVGGQNDGTGLGRGGALVASDWEWGGYNPNTHAYEFDQERPGWGKPIHNVLVENGVNVVFHGHDHVFVKEEHADGIIYQTVPQPSVLNDTDTKAVKRADESGYDVTNGNVAYGAGFIKVNIEGNITSIEYIRTLENNFIAANCTLSNCSEIAYRYEFTPNNAINDVNANSAKSGNALVEPEDAGYNKTYDVIEENINAMLLSSTALKYTGNKLATLPLPYTCDGKSGGISPTLTWTGIPNNASHLTLTMHSEKDDGTTQAHFTLFNINAGITTLAENDFSIGTISTGDNSGTEYSAPCALGAGTEKNYTFTLYAQTSALSVNANATQADIKAALSNVLIQSTSLTTQRSRYDDASIASNLHVPTTGSTSCEEKTAHFEAYSAVHKSVTCDHANNQLSVVSHISDGLKTMQSEQQIQVGINSWIGRLPLVSQAASEVRITPNFLPSVNNNIDCAGTEALGVTVDGQLILPYFKQNNSSGSGANCGEADGNDYASLDTVVLGEVDQCYGHSPNGEGYHLHGAPVCLMDIHDPSKPIAYMADGIPLYFGQAGGTILHTLHAQTAKTVTDTNYGSGHYEHLDYRPSDVKNGTNPLNECNAYDINNDGTTSGYAYYSTQDAPYTIGCFMGEKLASPNKSSVTRTRLEGERTGWSGQTVGEAIDVSIIASDYQQWNGKTYNVTEMLVNQSTSYLTAGNYAQVLWRVLGSGDTGYVTNKTCFEFRYRANKNITSSDETEVLCTIDSVPNTTLDFTPFGDNSKGEAEVKTAFKIEAWADNWFAAYLEDALIVEDSISITTERSFNAETAIFEASYPLHLNFILKDYKENDTGLEYIGASNQQMGDGGFIAQITDLSSNEVVAITNDNWQCTTIHEAPLNKSCENENDPIAGSGVCQFATYSIPSNWKASSFDDSSWADTQEYTEAEVSPKAGYLDIDWHDNATFIWGADLETTNTLLCRVAVSQP